MACPRLILREYFRLLHNRSTIDMAHPIAAAAAISLLWKLPSSDLATNFSKHNALSAELVLKREIDAFNACLDHARSGFECLEYSKTSGVCVKRRESWMLFGHRYGSRNLCQPDDFENLMETQESRQRSCDT